SDGAAAVGRAGAGSLAVYRGARADLGAGRGGAVRRGAGSGADHDPDGDGAPQKEGVSDPPAAGWRLPLFAPRAGGGGGAGAGATIRREDARRLSLAAGRLPGPGAEAVGPGAGGAAAAGGRAEGGARGARLMSEAWIAAWNHAVALWAAAMARACWQGSI